MSSPAATAMPGMLRCILWLDQFAQTHIVIKLVFEPCCICRWDWERWECEIDCMALNGINLPLAFTGAHVSGLLAASIGTRAAETMHR